MAPVFVEDHDRIGGAMPAIVFLPEDLQPNASKSVRGVVMIDTSGGLTIDDGLLGVSAATASTLGTVRPDGTSIVVDSDGTIHTGTLYVLPPASPTRLGGVRPDGTTITVEQDGTIHGTEQTPIATTGRAGKVRPDGTTITVDQDGTIRGATTYVLPVATTAVLGGVRPDGTTITVDGDGTIHGAAQETRPPGPYLDVREDRNGTRRLAVVTPEGVQHG